MYDQGATKNSVATSVQLQLFAHKINSGDALVVSLQAGQIAKMMGFAVAELAMSLLTWVEMTTSAQPISAGAVAFFMDMKSVLAVRRQPLHTALYTNAAVSLREKLHGTADLAAFGGLKAGNGLNAFAMRCSRRTFS